MIYMIINNCNNQPCSYGYSSDFVTGASIAAGLSWDYAISVWLLVEVFQDPKGEGCKYPGVL